MITPQAVRAQVDRILTSEAFVRSRRMQRFLEFIVEETLAGRADQLGEYTIGINVFDRGSDFEPGLDPIVRNDARRLRLKLVQYYLQSNAGAKDNVLIDVPKGGYAPVFLPVSARRDDQRRLAVLPFEVFSSARESEMHSRSLCMSLTARLTNVDGMEAVSHGYVRENSMRDTASDLGLSHVIHGSVFHSNDQCRVIINLVEATDGRQLWAREYDFNHSEMLAAHSEIASNVFREVSTRLGLRQPLQPKSLALAA